jgi:hypothetical protein
VEDYSIHFDGIERFQDVKTMPTIKENIYYLPIKKNEETADSFSIQEKGQYLDIYQFTVNKKHDIKTNGLKNIMDQCKNWQICRVIFVVPDVIYSGFFVSHNAPKLPARYSFERCVLQIPLSIKKEPQ